MKSLSLGGTNAAVFLCVCWSEPGSRAKLPDFEAWLFPFLPGSLWAIFASTSPLLNGAYVKGFVARSKKKQLI